MYFESATRSVVRSVRQSDLLNAWLRVANRERALPLIHQFRPDHLEEEKPDLMYYDLRHEGDDVRFLILHGGKNLARAFATRRNVEGLFLDEFMDAERIAFMKVAFLACIDSRRPVYTVSRVSDVNGVPVSYERLALPFGANANVQHLVVSLKTISIEGRFETGDLMRPQGLSYEYCAIIDRDIEPAARKLAAANDVVEI